MVRGLRASTGIFFGIVLALNVLLLGCINPVNEPLEWLSAFDLPITNKKYFVEDQVLARYDSEKVRLITEDSTLAFSIERDDSADFEITQDRPEPKRYKEILGPLTLSDWLKVETGFSRSEAVVEDTNINMGPKRSPIPAVESILFHENSNDLNVRVYNNFTTELSNVYVGLGDLGQQHLGTIAQGSHGTVQFDVAGQEMLSEIEITLQAQTAEDSLFGEGVVVEFDFDGLLASKYSGNDQLLKNYSQTFSFDYRITDDIFMEYIDVHSGTFNYLFDNSTDLNLQIDGHHQNLWLTEYSNDNDLFSLTDLKDRALDSTFHRGKLAAATINSRAKGEIESIDVSGIRMFPHWDTLAGATMTSIEYGVSFASENRRVDVSEGDTLIFEILAPSLIYQEFGAKVMNSPEPILDTQFIEISMPPLSENSDSLVGRLILTDVSSLAQISPSMTERTFIDTLNVTFSVFDPKSPDVVSYTETKLYSVRSEETYTREIDLTDVANQFPDTAAVIVGISMPEGTRLRNVNNVNEVAWDENLAGKVEIATELKYSIDALLKWKVIDEFAIDLGTDTFSVPAAMRAFRKMEQREAEFETSLENNTNLSAQLFAILAPQEKLPELDSLSNNEVSELVADSELAYSRGFVNLLGEQGIYLPPRSQSSSFSITLSDKQLERMLQSDTCSVRWQKIFKKQTPADAIHVEDYIHINSWIYLRGVNNSDSLIIW
ncbi:hypothetical protein QA601_05090 [Chitinispirillales bacterium ANBcel5]|uniref:hypothetical protein n=1 Tax=Cellulosispirillum alkaliphilum TaxID=3039283 RepID=UPI002A595CC8|nr:hypothetical protein [Chitinispirillales bacterium ANBcel5]